MSDTKLARVFFDANDAARDAQHDLDGALFASIGVADGSDAPFDDITYDDYDSSFEFKNVAVGWAPTTEMLSAWWALGFGRCWLCYVDGTEKYYAAPPRPKPVADDKAAR